MTHKFIRGKQRGLTLIEVLIAEALIGIVVLGMLLALANAYHFLQFTNAREKAKNFAEYQMEYIKKVPFNVSGNYSPNLNTPVEYTGFTVSVPISVTTIGTDTTTNQPTEQKVTITVTGQNVTYSLSDYKINYVY